MLFRIVLMFAFALGLAMSSPARAQTAPSRRLLFEQQRKQFHESVLQYPLIRQQKVTDVLRMRVSGSGLLLETPVEPDREYTQHRAELDAWSEPAVILCWLLSQDLGQVQFEIEANDYSDPEKFGRLHLQARPNPEGKELDQIEIEKTCQTANGFSRVYLTQVNGTVRLQVFANDQGPLQSINASWGSKDFSTFRIDHPAEAERWVRPILRELHQEESVFGADPAIAWQVLSGQWPINGALAGAVRAKLNELDSDNYRDRLRAADELEKLGRDGALIMQRMSRRGLSPEQNVRLDEVISRFKPLREAEALRLGNDVNFLLDCLCGQDATARRLALDRLRLICAVPIDVDPDGDEQQRLNAVSALRLKLVK